MITISPFQIQDAQQLIRWIYPELTEPQAIALICEWNSGQYEGKYFQMFGVWMGTQLTGTVSLMETDKNTVSFGIQIHPNYRRQGVAYKAAGLAMEHARLLGYRVVISQVRQDNTGSIALHKKLGFSLDRQEINRKGNPVNWYYLKLA